MSINKIYLSSIALVIFCTASNAQAQNKLVADGLVAIVGKDKIQAKTFNKKFQALQMRVGTKIPLRLLPLYKQRLIDELIETAILKQMFKKYKIQPKQAQIDKSIATLRKKHPTQESFNQFVTSQYGDEVVFGKAIETQIAKRLLIKKITKQPVTRKDAKAFYNKKKKSKYLVPEQVRASHILIRVPRRSERKVVLKGLRRAEKIAKLAQAKNADFATLARKHSEGPSKDKGGDLGFFTQDKMVKSFGKAAFGLDVGGVSDPVRSQFGYHIIKVFKKQKARVRAFKEVESQIVEGLQSTKNRRIYEKELGKYTKKLTIKRFPNAIQIKVK